MQQKSPFEFFKSYKHLTRFLLCVQSRPSELAEPSVFLGTGGTPCAWDQHQPWETSHEQVSWGVQPLPFDGSVKFVFKWGRNRSPGPALQHLGGMVPSFPSSPVQMSRLIRRNKPRPFLSIYQFIQNSENSANTYGLGGSLGHWAVMESPTNVPTLSRAVHLFADSDSVLVSCYALYL